MLTIVLTVYNKAPYLVRALDSLLSQKATKEGDYEILIVNDGSTDESPKIIDEYAAKDSKIRVLTQHNQGLSMARNNGTNDAMGDYVWYVDADDSFILAANVMWIDIEIRDVPKRILIHLCTSCHSLADCILMAS